MALELEFVSGVFTAVADISDEVIEGSFGVDSFGAEKPAELGCEVLGGALLGGELGSGMLVGVELELGLGSSMLVGVELELGLGLGVLVYLSEQNPSVPQVAIGLQHS